MVRTLLAFFAVAGAMAIVVGVNSVLAGAESAKQHRSALNRS
jgi:hypothetical protein